MLICGVEHALKFNHSYNYTIYYLPLKVKWHTHSHDLTLSPINIKIFKLRV